MNTTKARKRKRTATVVLKRLVRYFEEYPEHIRPRLRDIRSRKRCVLAVCEYQCRSCRLIMDDTQSDLSSDGKHVCCPRCESQDLIEGEYMPNHK